MSEEPPPYGSCPDPDPYEADGDAGALRWLQDLLNRDDEMWRAEISADYMGVHERYYEIRLYPLDLSGWCGGRATTLAGAIWYARAMVEKNK